MIPKLTAKENTSIDYYSKNSEIWFSKHNRVGKIGLFDMEMKKMFKLKPTGSILEIGCGPGEDAQLLVSHYGLKNYVGIEPAEGFITLAKKNNPSADFRLMSIYDLKNFPEKFDCIWACAVLIHLPKTKLASSLNLMKQVLNPHGVIFFSVMEGNADLVESRPGRFYSLWSPAEISQALTSAGLTQLFTRRIDSTDPHSSPWLTYLVKPFCQYHVC